MKTYGLNDALRSCARVTAEALLVATAAIAASIAFVYVALTGRRRRTADK